MADRGPIKFSPKQLWQDLILFGSPRENKDEQLNLVLLCLWKVLPKGKQFTALKEGSEGPSVSLSALPLMQEFHGWIPFTRVLGVRPVPSSAGNRRQPVAP